MTDMHILSASSLLRFWKGASGALAFAAMAFAAPAFAQEDFKLPEIIIGGEKEAPATPDDCNDQKPGQPGDFNCLNQTLERNSRQPIPSIDLPTSSQSSDISRGIVNVPALKQQYGTNYGVSVFPQRPPPPVYNNPLIK